LWLGSSLVDEAAQAVGEDVRGDAFLRFGQQFAEMAAVAEHHVAQHDQAPAVTENFEGKIDRAAGAACVSHRVLQKLIALYNRFCYSSTSCKSQLV
jgi:hypothetical protein